MANMENFPAAPAEAPVEPVAPGAVGAGLELPVGPEGAELTPEDTAGMKPGLEDVDEAINDFKARAAIGQKRLDQFREKLTKDLFALMEDAGVDPGNLESVRGFLSALEADDPDLAELFDIAFSGLTGGEPLEAEEADQSLMDKYSNLAGPELGQGEGLPPEIPAEAPPIPPAPIGPNAQAPMLGPNDIGPPPALPPT